MAILNRLFQVTLVPIGLSLLIAAAFPPEYGSKGMVASDHPLASKAGAAILKKGGHAVDAVIATALAAGVVQPASSGLGGGGFAVVQMKGDAPFVLDFRERAPKAADRDIFVNSTKPQASQLGGLAVAIPGEAQGLAALHAKYGQLSLKTITKPALSLARNGFPLGVHLNKALGKLDPNGLLSVSDLFDVDDTPSRGEWVSRSRLGRSLNSFGKFGSAEFTEGWIAEDLYSAARNQDGILTIEDFKSNAPRERKPIVGKYRGWTVVTMPPPSSGGLVLLQSLQVLERVNISELGHNSSVLLHRYAETFQHSFADRARYMGDPDRINIPMDRLLSFERRNSILQSFEPTKTHDPDYYGSRIDIGEDSGTQHISVIDQEGNAVALTTTINTSFGSKVVGQSSGILLNNEMDDFVARPGVPNAYGLVGSEANSVSPLAIPLSSMSPTILISPDGNERISVGASGGPFIISSTLQVIVNIIDFGMNPSEAVSVPRIHHQWAPNVIFVDSGIPVDVLDALEEKGHKLKEMPFFSSVQVVHLDNGQFYGASDPRKGGLPAAP